jgi:hypothetical protein
MAEYFDADDIAELGAEGRTPFLEEGDHLVTIAEVTWGKSKKNKKDDVLRLSLDVLESSNPAVPPKVRRSIMQTNRGDYGQTYLMTMVKQLAAALNGMPVNHPKLNAPKGTPEAKAAGAAINAAFGKLVQGKYNGKAIRVVAQVTRKDGAVSVAKDGTPFLNNTIELVPEGWHPQPQPASSFFRVQAQNPPAGSSVTGPARTAAPAWEPPGAVADDSADMADGADFWNS